MRIEITSEGREPFVIKLPERIILNGFCATVAPVFARKKLRKSGIKLTGKMCRKFVRGFYKTRKDFGGTLDLVDVEAKDGTKVKITV